MGLNGAEVGGADPGPAQRIVDGKAGLQPLGFRRHDVVGITAAATGQQPAQRSGIGGITAAHQGQHTGPLREDETIAVRAVGARGVGGVVIAAGEGSHRGKPHQTQPVHRRLGSPRQHQVGPVVIEQHLGQHQRFGTGRTGGHRGVGAAMEAEVDGHLTGRGIGNQHRHRQRVHPGWSPGAELCVLLVHRRQAADAGAEHDSDAGGIDPPGERFRHRPGLARRDEGQLRAAVRAATQQRGEAVQGVCGDATGDPHLQVIGPGRVQGLDSGLAGLDGPPGAFRIAAEGRQRSPADDGAGLRPDRHWTAEGSDVRDGTECRRRCGI